MNGGGGTHSLAFYDCRAGKEGRKEASLRFFLFRCKSIFQRLRLRQQQRRRRMTGRSQGVAAAVASFPDVFCRSFHVCLCISSLSAIRRHYSPSTVCPMNDTRAWKKLKHGRKVLLFALDSSLFIMAFCYGFSQFNIYCNEQAPPWGF